MKKLNSTIKKKLHKGTVIPAHPLALTPDRTLDERRQRALTRYYLDAGAGGIAIGVHTTQFAIRNPEINLYETVLNIAYEEIKRHGKKNIIKIAGISGDVEQSAREASLAGKIGYDLVLLSNNGLQAYSEIQLLERAKVVSGIMPVFGFYLQPAVGGKVLSRDFWEKFSEIKNVHAIKIAPFNRYQTLDVVQAVCQSSRNEKIALYTGNDDNILLDLITTFEVDTPQGKIKKDIVGGLLGHWAVWTYQAVALLKAVHKMKKRGSPIHPETLTLAQEITDANAAFFDVRNNFKGCIAGLHEVLRRQRLLEGIWCLDPDEDLSPGQDEEISRVYKSYPHLQDDKFVKKNLSSWLAT
jgi:dihydrodipicolinate synthase/N-acetylneuraminate lyase